MGKKIVISAFAVISIAFFIHCRNTKLTKNNNQSMRSGTNTMNRSKNPSGLEYEIIKKASGNSPQKGNTVVVHYTGWLDENGNPGQKFDSSLDRQEPFSFKIGVGQVIKGWDEGVMSMKVGEKRRLFIPHQLGYGQYGAGRVIPPFANLIFDVELLQVL
jgi:peptidylprolyl isomerase